MPSHLALVLISSSPATLDQESNIRKVLDWMKAFKVDHKQIDGADPVNKDLRNELFGISNLRGVYPQVFLTNKADSTVFVGDFAKISTLVENNDQPAGSPDAFNTVFASAKQ